MIDKNLGHRLADFIIDDKSLGQIFTYFQSNTGYNSKSVIDCLIEMEKIGLVKFYKYYEKTRNYIDLCSVKLSDMDEIRLVITEQTKKNFRLL